MTKIGDSMTGLVIWIGDSMTKIGDSMTGLVIWFQSK